MGKVKGLVTELEEMNGPMDEPTGPSDAELADIENTIDSMAWEDIQWLDPDVEIPVK